jgi:hypothetical protein
MRTKDLFLAITIPSLFISISHLSAQNLIWAKQTGGDQSDVISQISTDREGNVYATGNFQGEAIDFDPGPRLYLLNSPNYQSAFITKTDPSGNLVWAKQMHKGSSTGNAITVDASGNVYTTGSFIGKVDFDPGPGEFFLNSSRGKSVFASKLDAKGNLVWAKAWGGDSPLNNGCAIKTDLSGNVIIGGVFQSEVDFGSGSKNFSMNSSGLLDAFVNKLDADGNLVWAKQFGGTNEVAINGLDIDASGNVYTTGYFNGIIDFDPGIRSNYISSFKQETSCVFVNKLDAEGNYVWTKRIGGQGSDHSAIAYGIVIEPSGNICLTGRFGDVVDFDPGSGNFDLSATRGSDAFVSKLDTDGNFIWATKIGGVNTDIAYSISLDKKGNIYVSGSFTSPDCDFNPGSEVCTMNSKQGTAYVLILNASGNFLWAGQTGSEGMGRPVVAVDWLGNIYTGGSFKGKGDFDPGAKVNSMAAKAGSNDIYLVKLSPLNELASK